MPSLNLPETIIVFAIVLGIMVLVHELGHFIMGKLCGVRVETFSIGFGTRLFGVKYGGTDYRVSALPLGGYVKFAGELPGEGAGTDPGDFNRHPRWQRVFIALAGPFANFILSFVLLALVARFHYEVPEYLTGPAVVDFVPQNSSAAHAGLQAGDTITKFGDDKNPTWDLVLNDSLLNLNHDVSFAYVHDGQTHQGTMHIVGSGSNSITSDPLDEIATGLLPREQTTNIVVATVNGGSPADQAGLQPGDTITQVDNFVPHTIEPLREYLKESNGAAVTLQVLRKGQPLTLHAQPQQMADGKGGSQYLLGFLGTPVPKVLKQLPLGKAIKQSVTDNLQNSTLVVRIIKGMFTRRVAMSSLSGPVGIAQEIGLVAAQGIWPLLSVMAMISLQLGIFNLLPIPVLDGGMILFLAIESVMRRDVNEQVKERVYQVAFVCIILLAVVVMFNDVSKLHLGH